MVLGPVRVVMVLPVPGPGLVRSGPCAGYMVPVPDPGKGEAIVRVYGACAWYSPFVSGGTG